jgi:hypothetical protein
MGIRLLIKASNIFKNPFLLRKKRRQINYCLILIMSLILGGCEKKIFIDSNNDPEYIFNAFWHEIDRNYSFFSYTGLNWDSIYNIYAPKINLNTTNDSLYKIITIVTDLLHDAHTNVFTPKGVTGNINYFEKYPVNEIILNGSYFKYYKTLGEIYDFGELRSSDIGYIKLKTFEGENENFCKIDSILGVLKDTKALILDVRSNRGGKVSNSTIVASRLADTTRFACKYRFRNGEEHNDFSEWINVYISPDNQGIHFNKPVAILTNRRTFSAAEWFVTFTDVLPNVVLVGDTTGGGSALPIIRELPMAGFYVPQIPKPFYHLNVISNLQVCIPTYRFG